MVLHRFYPTPCCSACSGIPHVYGYISYTRPCYVVLLLFLPTFYPSRLIFDYILLFTSVPVVISLRLYALRCVDRCFTCLHVPTHPVLTHTVCYTFWIVTSGELFTILFPFTLLLPLVVRPLFYTFLRLFVRCCCYVRLRCCCYVVTYIRFTLPPPLVDYLPDCLDYRSIFTFTLHVLILLPVTVVGDLISVFYGGRC